MLRVTNSQLNIICFFATLILSCSYLKIHAEKDPDLMLLEKVPALSCTTRFYT